MRFKRRQFLMAGIVVMVAIMFHVGLEFAQAPMSSSHGHLNRGTGSLSLEGKFKAGRLRIEAQDSIEGTNRTVIAEAALDSAVWHGVMFYEGYGHVVYAQVRDSAHSTTLVLSDTDDPAVGRLIVWNDRDAPEVFRIDIKNYLRTSKQRESILDGKGSSLDQVGKRQPLNITSDELQKMFGSDPALLQFMRETKPPDATSIVWECDWIKNTSGFSFLHLFWEGPGLDYQTAVRALR
jgi:hypothetical protein